MSSALPPLLFFGSMAALWFFAERRFRRAGYTRRRTPPTLNPGHVFLETSAASLRGGVRVRSKNATWPLAKLQVDRDWIQITSTFFSSVWIERPQVTDVVIVRGILGPGVLFRSDSGSYDGVIFWTFSPKDLEREFARFGWPVRSTPHTSTP